MFKLPVSFHVVLLLCTAVTCRDLQRRSPDYSTTQAVLGEQCMEGNDCIEPNTGCDEICVCQSGYEEHRRECKESATLGTECEDDERCQYLENSKCIEEKCACINGTIGSDVDPDKCLKLAFKEGDNCQANIQCHDITGASCRDGQCKLRVKLNGPCEDDADCQESLTCEEDVCTCIDTHVAAEEQGSAVCLLKATSLGTDCSEDAQCRHLNATCSVSDSTCQQTSPKDDAECTTEDACSDVTKTCVNSKCVCKAEFDTTPEGCKKRVEANITTPLSAKPNFAAAGAERVKIGSSCQADPAVCDTIKEAKCHEGICECSDTFVVTENSQACLRVADKEGDSCEIDKQCSQNIPGATCMGLKCVAPGKQKAITQNPTEKSGSVKMTAVGLATLAASTICLRTFL